MEIFHAMKIRKLIATSLLALLSGVMLVSAPIASAISFDATITTGDDLEGDITEDQCANLDENLAGALGCDTSDKIIDFTEFSGTLEGPDSAGYDSSLTQTTSARDFIQTIVNFALSFLGLVATVIVIYGGVLYVMSRGDEEMASKGKKTISYAVVGILIILGSFALVNTLIGAGGGGADSGLSAGVSGDSISEAGASFDVDAVLGELESISEDYLDAYQTLLAVSQEVSYLQSIEVPLIVDVEESDRSAGGLLDFFTGLLSGDDNENLTAYLEENDISDADWTISGVRSYFSGLASAAGSDYRDTYSLIDTNDIDNYIDDMREGIVKVQREVDSLSDTYEAAQNMYDYLRSGSSASLFKWIAENMVPDASALSTEELIQKYASGESSSDGCSGREYSDTLREFGLGYTVYQTNVDAIDDNICALLDQVLLAAVSDYQETVLDLQVRIDDIRVLFDVSGADGGSTLDLIVTALDTVASRLMLAEESVSASTVRDLIADIGKAYDLIKNIEFVSVKLTASTYKGNAPLIVRFDALGTLDPSGDTVQDDQFSWDLDGDGDFEVENGKVVSRLDNYDIGDSVGDNVSKVFTEPGTYRVRVRVVSSEDNIAAGVATSTIIVEPAKSVFIINATAGGEVTTLADFSDYPAIDVSNYKVTMTQAQEGISLDASQSTDGDGNQDGLIFAEWDFGDGETTSGAWETVNTLTHYYGEEGTYEVSLTITDETGVEDRNYFKIYVGSPAARIDYSPSTGAVGDSFVFDGSGSSTDLGSIISYSWSANLDGTTVVLDDDSGSSVKNSFTKPGIYEITLNVVDSSELSDSASVEVLVESQAPNAIFEYEIPKTNYPANVDFDASDSYDPDEGDTISYSWDFDGIIGEDYDIIEGDEESDLVSVQFLNKGSYDVILTVCDQHEEELQKCDEQKKTVTISSVLDVELSVDGDNARHLDDNGEADVDFTALSDNATGFEVDYGDGETEFTEIITRGESNFTHTYDSAGVFYVTLTAYDDDENTNSITRRLYIANADSPVAVIQVTADGEDIGFGASLTGSVNTKFSFDASKSVNIDGTSAGLLYSWNFGDGKTSTQSTVTKTYVEHATYQVTLTVKDKDDPTISSSSTIDITIENIDPEIRAITITPQGTTLETPLKVNVEVDAVDEDGEITYVKAWYYDLEDSADELGSLIAQSTNFTLTINTKGEEGDEVEYGFAVEISDDSNNIVSSFDELAESEIPTLTVINGPNDTPIAAFSVDRTSVYVGEEVNFSSSSYDPDGDIVSYIWDIEGDGFFNNDEQEKSTYTYSFTQVHTDGVQVRLKVEDDSGATAVSDPVTIYVDANSKAPVARFLADVNGTTVTFKNNSDIDTENFAELEGVYWDFDLETDSDGSGQPDDDFDSFEENPTYTYPEFGTYQVSFTVVDTTGQTDTLIQDVNVLDTEDPVAGFSYSVDDSDESGLTIKFKNLTEVDEANDVDVRSYSWDFDLETDSDGDGDPENDEDSAKKSPSYIYESYGEYEVLLTVVDTFGKTDSAQESVDVANPIKPVQAILTSVPSPNSLGQISMTGTEGDLTLFYNATGGSGNYSFSIDKNIFYDTEGDGIRDNDEDHTNERSGSWRTRFFKAYGQTVVKLTVTDEETGETDYATLQVVFPGSLSSASLFNATPSDMILLLLSALLTAVLGVSLVYRHSSKNRITIK